MKKMKQVKNQSGLSTAFDQVQKFYQFMNTNKLEAIEFAKNATYIKLVRKHTQTVQPIPVFSTAIPQHSGGTAQHTASKPHPAAPTETGETIKAPMSGIFYRAPSPSSPPYAREGDQVKEGQVLCVIEAMKVFNEIKAEFNCVIKKVLVENGKPLELNQDIFLIQR
ncbi:MAG TPA: acetyl-CoA carboxylase, biotin carboxyl carrier protein [Elusimicrobia bacterium]|nr:acetyl-CoA carboxylase, biotin carboxyl carrier protein [Elusimicrobiota bacterium]